MQRLLMTGILTGLVMTSAPAESEMTQPSSPAPSDTRYDVHLTYDNGLRFVYPEGYRVDSATNYRSPAPDSSLLRSWEIWKAADYIPFGGRYAEAPTGTELPPHISIELFQNPEGKPLEAWMELATAPAEVITLAGRGAITYTATGLYEYDVVLLENPAGQVVKLQVGYIDAADPMRQVFQTVVQSLTFDQLATDTSTTDIDYSRLQSTLQSKDWLAADLETRAILMRLTDSFDYFYPHIETDDIASLPCEDLKIIDGLWSRYSNGQYGLAAQLQVWQSLTGNPAQAVTFGERVGWRRAAMVANDPFGNSLWRSDREITYIYEAPTGHLPWLGVSSMTLDRMIMDSGPACGTCTVDAMYISSDRYPDFLNAFMARVDECLCAPDEAP